MHGKFWRQNGNLRIRFQEEWKIQRFIKPSIKLLISQFVHQISFNFLFIFCNDLRNNDLKEIDHRLWSSTQCSATVPLLSIKEFSLSSPPAVPPVMLSCYIQPSTKLNYVTSILIILIMGMALAQGERISKIWVWQNNRNKVFF